MGCTYASGSLFPIGTTLVTCTATDSSGNATVLIFNVVVQDTEAPTPSMLDDITVEADSPDGSVVSYVVTATDTADATPEIICDPVSGSTFPISEDGTTVSCDVTDDAGNTSDTEFTVTVLDTTPPDLTLPADISVAAVDAAGATVNYSVSATDAASATVEVTCDVASGTTYPIGTTIVTCTATGTQGPTSTASFNISVQEGIVWITPIEDTVSANIGPNLNLRWGYGSTDNLINSRGLLATEPKSTKPIKIIYLGQVPCGTDTPILVDIDAGKSSLRYSQGEWQLNWQTGQSLVVLDEETGVEEGLVAGCYIVNIPRGELIDIKTVILD